MTKNACCAVAEHRSEPLKSDFVLTGSVCLQPDRDLQVRSEGRLGRPAAPQIGQHARHVTGIGDALDRRHHQAHQDPSSALHQGRGISNESSSDVQNERLHLGLSRVI